MSVKALSHPGHGIQVQVESKATGLSVVAFDQLALGLVFHVSTNSSVFSQ